MNCLTETVQMRGHKSTYGLMRNKKKYPSIIIKYPLLSRALIAWALPIPYQSSQVSLWAGGPRSAVSMASDSSARGPGFDTQSGHIFLLPLIQDRQLSAAGESMCTKYWLTA